MSAEFELIRREEGLESRLYDGMITAHVILKNIRPGDISYPTRRSQIIEITFPKNWDMDTEEFSRSLAAAEYRYRIHPAGRTLQLRHDYKNVAAVLLFFRSDRGHSFLPHLSPDHAATHEENILPPTSSSVTA